MPSPSYEDRASYWQTHIDNSSASGLSGAAYCQGQGLAYCQFIYWKRKLGKAQWSTVIPATGFAEVVLQSPRHSSGGLYLRLLDGVEIHGIDRSNVSVVQQLLLGL